VYFPRRVGDNGGMAKYLKISKAFHLGEAVTRACFGTVVASRAGFYLVVDGSAFGATALGALTAVVIEQFLGPLQLAPGVVVTDLAELPVEVTGHPDWPVRQEEGPVTVLPRMAIRAVRYSFWKWGIYLCTETTDIRIEPPLFGRRKVFGFLREAGWEVEGSG
jgi:hypothetical protein